DRPADAGRAVELVLPGELHPELPAGEAEGPVARPAADGGGILLGVEPAGAGQVVDADPRPAAVAMDVRSHDGLILVGVAAAGGARRVTAGVGEPQGVPELVGEGLFGILSGGATAGEETADPVVGDDGAARDRAEGLAVEAGRVAEEGAADRQDSAPRAVEGAVDLLVRVAEEDGVDAIIAGEPESLRGGSPPDVVNRGQGVVVPGGQGILELVEAAPRHPLLAALVGRPGDAAAAVELE